MADQGAEGLLSPFLRRQRVAAVRGFLRGPVLDVGCGSGALAAYVDHRNYVGVDPDPVSIAAARCKFPEHTFRQQAHGDDARFETVVALAVIEHVPDPVAFLRSLKSNLNRNGTARIVCTTPHPSIDWIHWVGARAGLFSRAANDEHEDLLDRKKLSAAADRAGLSDCDYRRFLCGANQVITFAHADLT